MVPQDVQGLVCEPDQLEGLLAQGRVLVLGDLCELDKR